MDGRNSSHPQCRSGDWTDDYKGNTIYADDVVALVKDLAVMAQMKGVPPALYRVMHVFTNGKVKLRQLHKDGSLGYAFNKTPACISLWRKG